MAVAPRVVELQTDDEGDWQAAIANDLPTGSHTVMVLDESGELAEQAIFIVQEAGPRSFSVPKITEVYNQRILFFATAVWLVVLSIYIISILTGKLYRQIFLEGRWRDKFFLSMICATSVLFAIAVIYLSMT